LPPERTPRTVTVLGLGMSLGWWICGWFAGFDGFLLNVAAAHAIVGPALFFSNIVVKRLQDARGQKSIGPLLQSVNRFLCVVFETTDAAIRVLGYAWPGESREALLDHPDFSALATSLRRAQAQLISAVAGVDPFLVVHGVHPIVVPQFSLVSKLVQQADRHYQMPWSVTGAVIADDWAQTVGIDFAYQGGIKDRVVGLTAIRQESEALFNSTAGASVRNYLDYVRGCLHQAVHLASQLANEAPPLLFVDPADRPWAVRRRNAKWLTKRITRGVLAGPPPPRVMRG
jgi:hypothetical protein